MSLTMSGIELCLEDDLKKRLAEIIVSRNYWLFVPGREGLESIEALEEMYYTGEAAADFQVVVGAIVPGCFGIATAHKRRLNTKELARFLQGRADSLDNYVITEAELRDRDIIFLAPLQEGYVMGQQFERWIRTAVMEAERKGEQNPCQ